MKFFFNGVKILAASFVYASLAPAVGLAQVSTLSVASTQQMKLMLVTFKKGMGKVSSAQERVFQEEVVLQPEFFLKNVRQEQQKIFADIDQDALKGFLTFPQGVAQLELKVDESCLVCKKFEPEILKTIESAWARRGLKLFKAGESTEGPIILKSNVRIGMAIPDLSDSGHADEKHMFVKITHNWEGQVEDTQSLSLNENAPIPSNFQKVWNASLSSLGLKAYHLKQAELLKNAQEYLIRIALLREYSVFESILLRLKEKYPETYAFRLARGSGMIRLKGAQKREELIEHLRGLRIESVKVKTVLPSQDSEYGIEVKIE